MGVRTKSAKNISVFGPYLKKMWHISVFGAKMEVKTKNAKNMIVQGPFCSILKRQDQFRKFV